MTGYELAATIMAFFALIIAVLSFGQNSISTLLNLRETDRANKTAEKALEIALYKHKIQISPEIAAMLDLNFGFVDDTNHEVILSIQNRNQTKAIVNSIEIDDHYVTIEDKSELPCELFLNNSIEFYCLIPDDQLAKFQKEANGTTPEDYLERDETFRKLIKVFLERQIIRIDYSDEIGTKYSIYLMHDESKDLFVGSPIEEGQD